MEESRGVVGGCWRVGGRGGVTEQRPAWSPRPGGGGLDSGAVLPLDGSVLCGSDWTAASCPEL